jgi:two-component system, sensor histidine kinase and response regulator
MSADARYQQYKHRDFPVLKIGTIGGRFSSYPAISMAGSDTPYMLAQSRQSKDGYTIFTYSKISEIELSRSAKFQFIILAFISGAALILLITGIRRYLSDMRNAINAAESASRSKSTFLANMSHEIRTPMNGIIGMTELCLTTNITAEQQNYLNAVKSSADNLLSIINDILDFSKIEVGKAELDSVPFLLRTTIGQTLQNIAVRASEKGLQIIFNPAQDTPDALIGDPGRLRQILANLVGNAVKFTARGHVLVNVRMVEEDETDCLLAFSVQDEGIGIPPEKLSKIFDPFEQGDLSTTKSYGGTGLGLAISKNLVQLFDGNISVESEVGKGSTFTFTARFTIQQTSQQVHPVLPLKGRSALIVDDVAINRNVLADFLGKWGVATSLAENAATAKKALDESIRLATPFDFVLIDVQMPELDGWQLVEEIRRQPAHDSVYCILMPSAGMRGDSRRCRELRVDGYLTKPLIHTEVHDLLCLLISSQSPPPHAPVTRYQILENKQRFSILVAEDVPINQMLVETILVRNGHAVTIVENGEEAVQAWQRAAGSYDLIFMDIQMPILDGFQATRRIRELETSRGEHVPIVAMTAYAMREDMERCRKAGMDDFISKPFQPENILSILKNLVKIDAKGPQKSVTFPSTPDIVPQPVMFEDKDKIFNKAELLNRLGNQEKHLERFIAMFVKSVDQHLSALEEAIMMENLDAARRHAHTLKGAAANIGADRMYSITLKLEECSKEEGELTNLKNTVVAFTKEYELFKRETDMFVSKSANEPAA